ncbi:MAG: nucleotidyl transferase AbiEii/AbiGii toxin family protein [Planctomycetes bacterium]|nr:nucleotidyl transferase AbiEii/AbiGii toxin family protein [Planctomycetota bacterium]
MRAASEGLPRSVQVRLVRHARELGVDPNLVLTRFAVERFLYRLSRSPHADRFVLKGALLLLVWLGEAIRPTRDADLLGFGDLSDESMTRVFRDVCAVDVEPDAMTFLGDSVRVAAIRPEDAYGGKRVTLRARLGPARLRVQVDVGIGDAVTPEPEWLDYPSLLGFPGARLRAYWPETTIAEKLHAMVHLGSKTTRMRDFFDLHALAQRRSFEGNRLVQAIRATFERRGTPLPAGLPPALTPGFAESRERRMQWGGLLARSGRTPAPEDLRQVVERVAAFLGPAIAWARGDSRMDSTWPPGGPWAPSEKPRR